MKVLYVYAHQEPKSFNAALKETALAALKEKGHEVKLSDLYAMNFNPVLTGEDFTDRKKPDVFKPFLEAIQASKTGAFAPDILAEMEKVKWADLLIFQFPIYFTSMPAILKGWIDRVLAPGFGFNPLINSAYETGLLKGKTAMITTTTGASEEWYSEGGEHGDLNRHLESVTHCVFEYMGMKVLPSHIIYEVSSLSKERGAEKLGKYRKRISEL
ncbi:glutathione-regulated potassium-efflux system ancillary protein KefG [Methanosarcina siciliae T4/M]|uniref:Glutathione-regulated potassium-efflux system ancillary protein KefG n=1 Tax=Methanosarcina siciliae T4/M TaxID=1434120 RepID=A0A0E3P125_9EURY|nr:NAD(P)H-dependent oxidoreductase [Methanosarcina siciliae]AKB26998.1 glutathione-regulated potassium-efflux system ancillary protein KefG [Methanosarcina siciliae T4/M]